MMARPTSLRIGGRLRGRRPCQAVAHTWAGLSGRWRGWSEARKRTSRLRIGQGWESSAHVGRWLALGRERGGAARAFSRPRSSGLVEAQRDPPPRAEPGLQPGGAGGGSL